MTSSLTVYDMSRQHPRSQPLEMPIGSLRPPNSRQSRNELHFLYLKTRFIKVFAIAIPTHLYNKKTVTMSYNYILKRICAYRQQILKENKETCHSFNQIIGY
jgi:hypothetical protein